MAWGPERPSDTLPALDGHSVASHTHTHPSQKNRPLHSVPVNTTPLETRSLWMQKFPSDKIRLWRDWQIDFLYFSPVNISDMINTCQGFRLEHIVHIHGLKKKSAFRHPPLAHLSGVIPLFKPFFRVWQVLGKNKLPGRLEEELWDTSSALLFFILLYLSGVWQRLTWGDVQDFCWH